MAVGKILLTLVQSLGYYAGVTFLAVKTTRLFEEVSRQIWEQIQSGALAGGEKLPNERELAGN